MWCYILSFMLHQYLFAFSTPPSLIKRLLEVSGFFISKMNLNQTPTSNENLFPATTFKGFNVTVLHCIEEIQWNICWRPSSKISLAHTEWLQ